MAASTVKIDWKWGYFVVLLVFILMIKTFKRFVSKVHRILYAWIYSFFTDRRNRQLQDRKELILKELQEISQQMTRALCILEIGAGPGSNFKYFPKGTNVMCLDPNPYFEKYLRKNVKKCPDINLQEFLAGRAEDLSILPNGCVDAVVSTSVLCSVSDVDQSIAEVKRVLRPGGKFLYIEHTAAGNKTWIEFLQRCLNPISRTFSSNCHLMRDLAKNISSAGFSQVHQEQFDLNSRLLIMKRPHLYGKAIK